MLDPYPQRTSDGGFYSRRDQYAAEQYDAEVAELRASLEPDESDDDSEDEDEEDAEYEDGYDDDEDELDGWDDDLDDSDVEIEE